MKHSLIDCDVVLIGAGIMSATLATFLQELEPHWSIQIFERLDAVGLESSNTLNNAGTGHAALCELHYTPERKDGTIDTSRVNKVMESFEISKQFRAYLTEKQYFSSAYSFIHSVPHMSVVFDKEHATYLYKRFQALQEMPLFAGIEYSTNKHTLRERMPLIMQGRPEDEVVAATRSLLGTDVNFGLLTQGLFDHLKGKEHIQLYVHHEVRNLEQHDDTSRTLMIKDLNAVQNNYKRVRTKFVFIGSGGTAMTLLARSGIPEGKQYGGFPVDGQRLICNNPDIIEQHHAKVYGKPTVGAPPMSVPHLDTRYVDGKKALLFGPYAGFTTKFLKKGSVRDLFTSLTRYNLWPMLQAGRRNIPLTLYLLKQITQNTNDRLATLRTFFPHARAKDRDCELAGKRVQIIKKDPEKGAILQFGTEVVVSDDKTLSALLGASPGASTSVAIILELLQKAFPEKCTSPERQEKLATMIPSYGKQLAKNLDLAYKVRTWSHEILGLIPPIFPEEQNQQKNTPLRIQQATTEKTI